MQERRFVESFNAAVEGFIYVLKTERNMRVHFLAAILIVLVGICLDFTLIETAILAIAITAVLASEIINTALELLVDIIRSEIDPAVRTIKDVSAAAVLLTSINALIAGYMLFSRHIPFRIEYELERIRRSPWHITFISLIIVFSISIFSKLVFHKGTPLRGGMPSGHSAIAFAIWTIVSFLTNNALVIVLTFVLAFIVARHRVTHAIHNIWEVAAGSLLGILVTTLIFQLLR